MSDITLRLDRWASTLRNAEDAGGFVVVMSDEAMELSTLLTEAVNELSKPRKERS